MGTQLIARKRDAGSVLPEQLFRDGFEDSMRANPAVEANGVQYYLNDHLGSNVGTTDENGNVIEVSRFAPYGERWIKTAERGPAYAGHFEDATGLTYMKARYY